MTTAPIDPARAEAHARHNVAGQGSVVATSVVAALLDELDRTRVTVRELREPIRRDSTGEDDADVWLPPLSDCVEHRADRPCPHCWSVAFHHRTERCAGCGRRPGGQQ